MKVWQVGVSDCEGTDLVCVCLTKKLAKRELFKVRDELVKEYAKMSTLSGEPCDDDGMYGNMIFRLSSDSYTTWDNFPHETPWMREVNVIVK